MGSLKNGSRRIIGLIALLACVTLGGLASAQAQAPVQAQATTPVTEEASKPSAELDVIPVPLIPERTDALQQSLRRFKESAAVDPAVLAIENELPNLTRQLEHRLEVARALLAGEPSLQQLQDAESAWSGQVQVLSSRRRVLAVRASGLENEMESLEVDRALWSRSLERARESQAPVEVLNTVRSNLEAIEAVTGRIRAQRSQVLTLLTAVSEQELMVSEALEQISATRKDVRSRLFEPDSEPLWTAVMSDSWEPVEGLLLAELKREWGSFVEFLARKQRSLPPVAMLFAATLLLMFQIRRGMRRRAEVERLVGSAASFERSISVALLMTAFFIAWAYPFAPLIIWEVIGLVLVIPVLRVLLPTVPDSARPVLGLLAVFYLMDLVRELMTSTPLLERTTFFVEVTIAAGLVIFLLQPSRMRMLSTDERALRTIGLGLRAALVGLGTSSLANVLGFVAFARLMGEGSLTSIHLSLIAYAGYRIATTLLLVFLSSHRFDVVGVIRRNAEDLLRWGRRFAAVIAMGFWVTRSMDAFVVRDVVFGFVDSLLFTPFDIGTVSLSVGSVFAFPLTIFIAFTLSRAIRALLEEDVYPRVTLGRGVANAVTTSVHYVLLLSGFFLAIGAAGIDMSRFTLLAGAFGVGIGFGLQTVVNNFVSGLILLYERPIQVGDTIELTGLLGDVKHIGIRASTLVTFQGAEVIVPNGNLLSDQLINWTLSNQHRRVEFPVGVAYGNAPSAVIQVLKSVLDNEDRVLRHPEPQVLFKGFGDSSLDFEVRFWAPDYRSYVLLSSDVAAAIYDELERVGISIPFPQRDLHLKSVDSVVAEKLRGHGEEA